MQRQTSFCNCFSTDFRRSEHRKSFKNQRKIYVFAKLGFAVPTPKNVDFGRHFGTRNASKIVQNGCPKTDGKSIAFRTPFFSILDGFGTPRPLQKSRKNRRNSSLLATCTADLTLERLGNPIWTVRDLPGGRFGCILDGFGTNFGRFWGRWGCPLPQDTQLRGSLILIRATRRKSIDRESDR